MNARRLSACDGLVTTGATLNACTEVLLDAGAASVMAAALASPYFGGDPV